MKYESLYDDFVSLFPEYDHVIKQLEETNAVLPAEDGMHVLFGFVVAPFVAKLIETDAEDIIQRSFNFFEEMALSGSENIGEVLDFTISSSDGDTLKQNCLIRLKSL